jgi:hemoglobin
MPADRKDASARGDLASREDIMRLVDGFYDRVREDSTLAPIFDGVARVDWGAHLPKMYDFWESVLFGTAFFKGNPLAVHRALARKTPMTDVEFGRWIVLFHTTVDELFQGPMATAAKDRAVRIAMTMQHHIMADAGASPMLG